jgi:hypothetical protein
MKVHYIIKHMKIKELADKYTKKDSKGSHSPKVDGKLL